MCSPVFSMLHSGGHTLIHADSGEQGRDRSQRVQRLGFRLGCLACWFAAVQYDKSLPGCSVSADHALQADIQLIPANI